MSRVIKFRVWDSEFKRMKSTGFSVEHGGKEFSLSCDDGILMQYTGLTDKNGVEIYEGDIIGGEWGGSIEYCDKCVGFVFSMPHYGCSQCEGDVHWYEIVASQDSLEVVGNVYETPEMLDEII